MELLTEAESAIHRSYPLSSACPRTRRWVDWTTYESRGTSAEASHELRLGPAGKGVLRTREFDVPRQAVRKRRSLGEPELKGKVSKRERLTKSFERGGVSLRDPRVRRFALHNLVHGPATEVVRGRRRRADFIAVLPRETSRVCFFFLLTLASVVALRRLSAFGLM